jgi:transcriptional regulator with XRE-family HTH domain
MSTNRQKFGELFRAARKRAGKTLGEVAHDLEISLPYLSDVERTTRPPLSLERIAQAAVLFRSTEAEYSDMLRAAADHQGAFNLPMPNSPKGREAGAALMRSWNNLDDDLYEEIVNMIARRKANGQ